MNRTLEADQEAEGVAVSSEQLNGSNEDGEIDQTKLAAPKCSGWKLAALATGALALTAYAAFQMSNDANTFISEDQKLSDGTNDADFSKYLQFIAKYNKFTKNEQEFKYRFGVFKENKANIDAHNKLYEDGIAPFDMTVN